MLSKSLPVGRDSMAVANTQLLSTGSYPAFYFASEAALIGSMLRSSIQALRPYLKFNFD